MVATEDTKVVQIKDSMDRLRDSLRNGLGNVKKEEGFRKGLKGTSCAFGQKKYNFRLTIFIVNRKKDVGMWRIVLLHLLGHHRIGTRILNTVLTRTNGFRLMHMFSACFSNTT